MLRIFSRPAERPRTFSETSARTETPSTRGGSASRKQLVEVMFRETLIRNSIPAPWLEMKFFRTLDAQGVRTGGIQVRLVVHDGHSFVTARMVELERDLRRRIALIDCRAQEWLQGVSWQLDLPRDDSAVTAVPLPSSEAAHGFTLAPTRPAPL